MIQALIVLAFQTAAPLSSGGPAVKLDFNMDEAMVRRFDRNKDGALSLGEFQDAMESELRKAIAATPGKPQVKKEDLQGFRASLIAPFRTFDRNASGSITLAEMRSVVSNESRKR